MNDNLKFREHSWLAWIFRFTTLGLLCAMVYVISQSKEGNNRGFPVGTTSSVATMASGTILLLYMLVEFWQPKSSGVFKVLMMLLFALIGLIGAGILYGLSYLIIVRFSSI